MSDGTQSIDDEHAVVGEPASHPHQAVVVGEPPEDLAPVLGEPAFANGLQDQQPITLPSVDGTSANGFQSTHHTTSHEESSSSSEVSAPSCVPPVEESPNLQQAEAIESGTGESSIPHFEEPAGASAHGETLVDLNSREDVPSTEEEPSADIPNVVEVTHIEDSPSEVPPSLSEVPIDNSYAALDEGQTDQHASGEIHTGDTEALAANASSTPDEISLKELADQQEATPLLSDVQEERPTESLSVAQTDADHGPLEGSKAGSEDVPAVELEHVGEGDAIAQESGAKETSSVEEETGVSVVEHPLAPELDKTSERDAFVQGNDVNEDIPVESEDTSSVSIPVESEAASREHVMDMEVSQSQDSTTESAAPSKDLHLEKHAVSNVPELQSNEETFVEAHRVDSLMTPQGTRSIAVEECLGDQPPPEETYAPLAANGNNDYQHCDDGEDASDRAQNLAKDDDDSSAEVEKPSSRSKLPLIFTGLAIVAVGVAVASISRPR